MADHSAIEWTEATWNPVTGCLKISPGCKNCYAERLANRLRAMGMNRYRNGFGVTLQQDQIDLPRKWKAPRLIFVNSMSDLFHEKVPTEYIERVFATIEACRQHTFQILTKRSDRLRELGHQLPWHRNVWMGVSVENDRYAHRIADLRATPSVTRFLSLEPLLSPIDRLSLDGIHWVIVGGESGPGARPMKPEWVRSIRRQCRLAGVPFFFKQWGGVRKHKTGRTLDGRTYDEMPPVVAKQADWETESCAAD